MKVVHSTLKDNNEKENSKVQKMAVQYICLVTTGRRVVSANKTKSAKLSASWRELRGVGLIY